MNGRRLRVTRAWWRRSEPGRSWTEDDLYGHLETLAGPALLLLLDGVQDPHNLGACLRTADACGALAVDRAAGPRRAD